MMETYVFYDEDDHFVNLHAVVDIDSLEPFIEQWKEKAKESLWKQVEERGLFKREDVTYRCVQNGDSRGPVHLCMIATVVQKLSHNLPPFDKAGYDLYESTTYNKTNIYKP